MKEGVEILIPRERLPDCRGALQIIGVNMVLTLFDGKLDREKMLLSQMR